MRYSIMLQLVAGITLLLLSAAALFAWIQTRTEPVERREITSRPASNERSLQRLPQHRIRISVMSGTAVFRA